jgi:hypothetical protein
LRNFEVQVDPDDALTDEERRRRADHALRAHMAKLSLMAAKARKARGLTMISLPLRKLRK